MEANYVIAKGEAVCGVSLCSGSLRQLEAVCILKQSTLIVVFVYCLFLNYFWCLCVYGRCKCCRRVSRKSVSVLTGPQLGL